MVHATGYRRKAEKGPKAHNTLVEELTDKMKEAGRFRLLLWHELPSWQQDNEFILSGYRPASGSLQWSLESLKYIHNESVNIYSHLFGAILFASLPIYMYVNVYPRYASADLGDIIVFSTFFWRRSNLLLSLSLFPHRIKS